VSAARRMGWGAAATALLSAGLVVYPVPIPAVGAVGRHHAPSAGALAHSQHVVAHREHLIKVAAAQIGAAKAALTHLNVTAEVAFEAYDGARVKLATTQRAVHTAQVVLAGANRQVAKGQRGVVTFAQAAYKSGGLSSLSIYLEPGGPSRLVSRVGAIDAISSSEHTTLQRFKAAQIYQGVVAEQAQGVEAKAASAARAAQRAKQVAAAAVARQQAEVTGLRQQQAHLQSLLNSAKSHASKLQQAHLAAVARARRRAATRAAAPPAPTGPGPYSGSSGDLSGTVSSATAAAALASAESQIGKPYVWAAAGPNSYDCSGLVMWAYAQNGVHLDHWTGDQWNEGAHVSRAQLRPGDLIFFAYNTSDPATIHHVGMYVGNGQMVDAPYTGVNVRYDYAFRSDYIGAVRPYQR
jgi:cell wall-associated NlpC family hydrolase